MHKPVLLEEVLHYLNPCPGYFIIDGTVDGGGHAAAIIPKLMPGGTFLGLDWDEKMLLRCEERLGEGGSGNMVRSDGLTEKSREKGKNIILLRGNYAELPEILEKEEFPLADGLLLDLGFSSEQLESSGKGFSFSKDEPLLMTYDDSRAPVRELLKKIREAELADIIFQFGGERQSRRIAKAIIEKEREGAISTSKELAETIRSAVPRSYERGRIDPATRTFQALRIYANGELDNLSNILESMRMIVKPGGRAAVISFHSLEDRIVKQAFQKMQKENTAEILTKKPVIAMREEVAMNPRARSAKLRAVVLR
jgi:16S rRNA (cytosine1402-N4)-methyltransferase